MWRKREQSFALWHCCFSIAVSTQKRNGYNECKNLHSEIKWHSKGNKKLRLLSLLVHDYGLDIDEVHILRMFYVDKDLLDYTMNHEKTDLEVRHVVHGVEQSPLESAFAENDYERVIKLYSVCYK